MSQPFSFAVFVFTALIGVLSTVIADDTPPFKITTRRDTDKVEIKVEKDKTVFSVNSPAGISNTVIERTEDTWPDAVVLRLNLKGMESFTKLGPEKLGQLVDFLFSLREARGGPETFSPAWDAGRLVYEQANCTECHTLALGKEGLAPTLARYGSAEWLAGVVRDPGHPLYYDKDNTMPAFGKTLGAGEIDDLVAFLRTLSQAEPLATIR